MRSLFKKLSGLIWHPFFLLLYALLSLLVANYGRISRGSTLRPTLLFFVLAGIMLVLGRRLFKDWHRAGLITSLSLLLFFSYGHIYGLLEGTSLLGLDIGRHRVLLTVFVLVWAGLCILIFRSKASVQGWTWSLNLITFILVVLQVSQLGLVARQTGAATGSVYTLDGPSSGTPIAVEMPVSAERPDIYFIILDTYTRQDAYQEVLGYDNTDFIEALRQRGFYIAGCSLSNYTATSASLIASLEMQYLDELNPPLGTGYKNLTFLDPFLQQNRVSATLKATGYTLVTFESGYMPTELVGADVYLAPDAANLLTGGLTRYESLVMQSSLGILVYDFAEHLPASVQYFLDAPYVAHRERILFELDQLGRLEAIGRPKFVFAHILAPHTPFVFTWDGQPVDRDTPFTLNDDPELNDKVLYNQRFIDQTLFINTRMLELIDQILAQEGDPVIILQGDHGLPSSGKWATAMLNAIRLPDGEENLYPTMSPVNTFRLVFNQLFDAGLSVSPDRSCKFKRGAPTSCEVFIEPSLQCALP
jgi:hypothetical protein